MLGLKLQIEAEVPKEKMDLQPAVRKTANLLLIPLQHLMIRSKDCLKQNQSIIKWNLLILKDQFKCKIQDQALSPK